MRLVPVHDVQERVDTGYPRSSVASRNSMRSRLGIMYVNPLDLLPLSSVEFVWRDESERITVGDSGGWLCGRRGEHEVEGLDLHDIRRFTVQVIPVRPAGPPPLQPG